MNLIVDVGNSLIKFAVFQSENLEYKIISTFEEGSSTFKNITENYSIENCIISSVANMDELLFQYIESRLNVLVLNSRVNLPFKNLYQTPKTLGVDRMALVSAAVKQYLGKDVLVIDAGTCITYDFVNHKSEYLGGAISPGIRLRYKSLNTFTANLPLLNTEMPTSIVGDTTARSIHSGVVNGIVKEIDGVIDEYQLEYEHLTVILTGGDADFLSKQLKNSIFANSNFLLEGLNYILEFNSH